MVYLILGIIFTILGVIFVVFGIVLSLFVLKEMILMSLIGLPFFIFGIVFLMYVLLLKKRQKRLLSEGNYVLANISGVQINYNVNVNGKCPYTVECSYQDSNGTIHIFQSKDIFFDPTNLFTGDTVKVYVDRDNYKKYYVDIDSVLPKVIRH